MMRFALALMWLASCGPSARPVPDPPPDEDTGRGHDLEHDLARANVPGREPTAPEARAMRRLQRVAEEVRSLRFDHPVPFRVQTREVITQFVRDQIDAEEMERARIFYVALGLLPPDLAIGELLIRVLGEQIVGYYDPEQSLMVVREDVARELAGGGRSRALGEAEMVIVHELVHALQDQRLDLGERYREERTIDGENAFAALVEGDATLAMIGHMVTQQGQTLAALTRNAGLLRMLIRNNPESIRGQEIEAAPPIVRLPLVSRYLDGMIYCATIHGTDGWQGVDRAHRHPPRTTEQILHPERYLAGELPDAITLPELPALTEAGLEPHEEDSLGELEMGIYFGLGRSDLEREESAADGWGGDRIRVYVGPDDSTAVVWFTTWDDVGEAREAEAAARAVADRAPATERDRHRVERRGRGVLVLRGLDPALHDAVRRAFSSFTDTLPSRPPTQSPRRNSGLVDPGRGRR